MELKFTNVSKDTATMLIYSEIGYMGVDGAYFANEMQWLNDNYADQIKCINVRINSPGGSVQDGLSICSAILNSAIPCDTYIDGMAYSMAGIVAMCGRKRSMVDYGTFMMHNAQGGADEQVLELITNSLAKIFERCTALTMDKCKQLMADETWMDAIQCMQMGLVDEVISTQKTKPSMANNTVIELYNFYNKLLTNKKMNKVTNLLKLSNDASEESIVEAIGSKDAAIEQLKSEIEANIAKNAELETKLAELQKSIEDKETAEKVELIENAVKEGKIDATTKDIYVNSNKSIDELKNLFTTLKPAYTPVLPNNVVTNNAPQGRENWTFQDWSKKDPQGLLEMKKNDETSFNNLISKLPSNLSPNYNPATDKRF
jgi:ATP-dependent protease ClpP protease subunit/predicted DNA-binding protein YlxM (UPF0122 family)